MLGILRCTTERSISSWHPSSVGARNALAISQGGNNLHATLHDITLVRTTTSVQCMTHGCLYPRSTLRPVSVQSATRMQRVLGCCASQSCTEACMQAANGSYAEAWAPYLGTLPSPEEVLAPEVFTPALLDALQSASMVRVACGTACDRQTVSHVIRSLCSPLHVVSKTSRRRSRHLHLATNNYKAAF